MHALRDPALRRRAALGLPGPELDKHGVPPLEDLVGAYAEKLLARRAAPTSRRSVKRACPTSTSSRAWATSASPPSAAASTRARRWARVERERGRRRRARLRTLLDVSVRLAGDHAAVLRGARAPLGRVFFLGLMRVFSLLVAFRGDGVEGVLCSFA